MLTVRKFQPAVTAIAIAITLLSASASADQTVPFKGQASETITQVIVHPNGLEVTTAGYGQATHLGRFFRIVHAFIHPDGTVEGLTGWIAANGDVLILELDAVPLSATTFAGTYTVVFGNGRFAGASGEADFYASTTDGLTYDIDFSGDIAY